MNSTAAKLSLVLVTGALAACTSVTVTSDYDHTAAFGKYKTYAVEPPRHGQSLSPNSAAALHEALRTELAARGLVEVAPAKANLAIVPHVFSQEQVSVQQYTDWGYGYQGAWPYGYGHYGMWAGAPRTYVDVTNYTEGTLIIDVVDTRTRKLVFRGTGSAVVGGSAGNAAKIREAVKKMVESLPPSPAH